MLYVNIRKDGKETKLWFHILVTCGIVGLALGIALPINNLGTVLEFTVSVMVDTFMPCVSNMIK